MKMVVLDGALANPGDLSWTKLSSLGSLTVYDETKPSQVVQRALGAEVVIINKVQLDAGILEQLSGLRCICLLATGYNNVDVSMAHQYDIVVCNAVGYSSPSVAQHVFAFILHFANHVQLHHESISGGEWPNRSWSFSLKSPIELKDKVLGIYGFGRIGQQVAAIGQAFGMRIASFHTHPERDQMAGVNFVELDELFKITDFLSLHAPLTAQNEGLINSRRLHSMKPTSFLINTGRGGLVCEDDLKHALKEGIIAGAGLDVLTVEPPPPDHPLLGLDNCILTPHNAWASRDSRRRLLDIVYENVAAFQAGNPINVVRPK